MKIIITKDAMRTDELLEDAFIKAPAAHFTNWHTVMPSTVGATIGMFLSLLPYQCNRKNYSDCKLPSTTNSLFYKFQKTQWVTWELFHPNKTIYIKKMGFFHQNTLMHFEPYNEYDNIHLAQYIDPEMDLIWLHYPHTLPINFFIQEVNTILNTYSCEIFVTADHGRLLGEHGKFHYGYDCLEPAIRVPLFVWNRDFSSTLNTNQYSHLLFQSLILNQPLVEQPFISIETKYKAQSDKTVCIKKGNWKLLWRENSWELFHIQKDPTESNNLLQSIFFDPDRQKSFDKIDLLHINRGEMDSVLQDLKAIVQTILSSYIN